MENFHWFTVLVHRQILNQLKYLHDFRLFLLCSNYLDNVSGGLARWSYSVSRFLRQRRHNSRMVERGVHKIPSGIGMLHKALALLRAVKI